MTWYKPLTPDFREKINESIDEKMHHFDSCRKNGFVNGQLMGYKALRQIINALPDGFLMPMEDKK